MKNTISTIMGTIPSMRKLKEFLFSMVIVVRELIVFVNEKYSGAYYIFFLFGTPLKSEA